MSAGCELTFRSGAAFVILNKAKGWVIVQRDPYGMGNIVVDQANSGWVPAGAYISSQMPTKLTSPRVSSRHDFACFHGFSCYRRDHSSIPRPSPCLPVRHQVIVLPCRHSHGLPVERRIRAVRQGGRPGQSVQEILSLELYVSYILAMAGRAGTYVLY